MDILLKYFPDLTGEQQTLFAKLQPLYAEWNEKINVISRKDVDNLYERHVIHSLAIAKVICFKPHTTILDAGTGGGFPGIPLAILFPQCQFHLVDSIGKKIRVVEEVAGALGLPNVKASQERVEKLPGKYDFVVSRAVTEISELYRWCLPKIQREVSTNDLKNGIICLKGGDLHEEFDQFRPAYKFYPISDFYTEEFFGEKKVVYVPA